MVKILLSISIVEALPFITKPAAPLSVKIPAVVDHVAAAADVKVKASALVVKLDAAPASNDIPAVVSIVKILLSISIVEAFPFITKPAAPLSVKIPALVVKLDAAAESNVILPVESRSNVVLLISTSFGFTLPMSN